MNLYNNVAKASKMRIKIGDDTEIEMSGWRVVGKIIGFLFLLSGCLELLFLLIRFIKWAWQ